MKKFERKAKIEELVKDRKYVLIADVVKELQVSESTVRRDISEMEKEKLLFMSQGAIIWDDNKDEHMENVYYRQIQNMDVKKVLSKFAGKLIKEGEVLYIDTGTTMQELARNLDDIPVTVVTNDLQVALELENKYNVTTIVLGGIVKRGTHTMIGAMSMQNLAGVHFDKAFISPGGITPAGGVMFYNAEAVEVRKAVMGCTQKAILVADNSKFGKNAFVSAFSFDQWDILVTNHISEEWRNILEPYMEIYEVE